MTTPQSTPQQSTPQQRRLQQRRLQQRTPQSYTRSQQILILLIVFNAVLLVKDPYMKLIKKTLDTIYDVSNNLSRMEAQTPLSAADTIKYKPTQYYDRGDGVITFPDELRKYELQFNNSDGNSSRNISIYTLGEMHSNTVNVREIFTIFNYAANNSDLAVIFEDTILKDPNYSEARNISRLNFPHFDLAPCSRITIIRKLHDYMKLHNNTKNIFSYDFRFFLFKEIEAVGLVEQTFSDRGNLNKLMDIILMYYEVSFTNLKKNVSTSEVINDTFEQIYQFLLKYFKYLFVDVESITDEEKTQMEETEQQILDLFGSTNKLNIDDFHDNRFDIIFEMFRNSFSNIDYNIINKDMYIDMIVKILEGLLDRGDLTGNYYHLIDIFTLNKIFEKNSQYDRFFLYFGRDHINPVQFMMYNSNVFNDSVNIIETRFDNMTLFLNEITNSYEISPLRYFDEEVVIPQEYGIPHMNEGFKSLINAIKQSNEYKNLEIYQRLIESYEKAFSQIETDTTVIRALYMKMLQTDRNLILIAVSNNGKTLQYATDKLKKDREVVLAAVSNAGEALQYASKELRNDRGVVLAAVSNDGRALQYASEELKSDPEVMLTAEKNQKYSLRGSKPHFDEL